MRIKAYSHAVYEGHQIRGLINDKQTRNQSATAYLSRNKKNEEIAMRARCTKRVTNHIWRLGAEIGCKSSLNTD